MTFELGVFLEQARRSSLDAYQCLDQLAEALEDPSRQAGAISFLWELWGASSSASFGAEHHFFFHTLTPAHGEPPLILLQLPSVFSPEEWSFTFYEGLSRLPPGEFTGRTIAELGCGGGWVTLALARKCLPRLAYGLDINPRSIRCSVINTFLNSTHPGGSWIRDSEGATLVDRTRFLHSDLLGALQFQHLTLDRILGCIPQVLAPDPALLGDLGDDEALVRLSNYCDQQGMAEDNFGLGLMARAIEESACVLAPTGKMLFNLGGRPGRSMLTRLFTRRGLQVRWLWQTKVEQAKDTDIRPLVAIESQSPHRFEFYMDPFSSEPICASAAAAVAESGGQIYHLVGVLEAKTTMQPDLKTVLSFLQSPGMEGARSALDLDCGPHPTLAAEKLSFLAGLAARTEQFSTYPYGETEGLVRLRSAISRYLLQYFGAPVSPESVVALPSASTLFDLIVCLFSPRLAFLDAGLAGEWRAPIPPGTQTIEVPRSADLLCTLMTRMRPQVAYLCPSAADLASRSATNKILETAGEVGCRLFLDVSRSLTLSTEPEPNGALYALRAGLSPHVALVIGLPPNQAFPEFQSACVLSDNQTLLGQLTQALELTFSRTPLLTQLYYSHVLEQLLHFQRPRPGVSLRLPVPEPAGSGLVTLADAPAEAFSHPAATPLPLPPEPCLRLDYGENALDAPRALLTGLWEAFARQTRTPPSAALGEEILALMAERFGVQGSLRAKDILFAAGVAPLFSALARHLKATGVTLVLPQGSYGHFKACATFHGTRAATVETLRGDSFKVRPDALDRALSRSDAPTCLYLNAPLVNPTGALYSNAELQDLLGVAARHQTPVILDTVFAGLEFRAASAPYRLFPPGAPESWPPVVYLGGISKELAAGGLRFGYCLCTHGAWTEALRPYLGPGVSDPLLVAVRKVVTQLTAREPALLTHLDSQRETLRRRAQDLTRCLTETGWEVCPPQGGLFLVAAPRDLLGRRLRTPAGGVTPQLTEDNLAESLLAATGVLINGPRWTGLPGYFRFVLSVRGDEFADALRRLSALPSLLVPP